MLSSTRSPWQGVYFEEHAGGAVEPVMVEPRKHLLIVQAEQATAFEYQADGLTQWIRMPPGHVSVFPAFKPFAVQNRDTRQYLTVAIEPRLLLCAAKGAISSSGLELMSRHAVDDPLARGVALALKAEVELGYPGGRWYAESLAHTLSVHLVRHYSTAPPDLRSKGGGLQRGPLLRAIDFIHDHLAEEIPLEALAAVSGLSPFHFARCFKQSTGLAPHQYLIQRRVERARNLLTSSDATVAQIALEVGFCDQSHLTTHFKRIYGLAPKAFMRQYASVRQLA